MSAPMDPAAEAAMQAALDHLRDVLTNSLTYLSCIYTLLIWDYLSTFKLEYDRIWKAPWNISKVIFLVNRYFGLACMTLIEILFNADIPEDTCRNTFWLEPLSSMVLILAGEMNLIVRVWALWDRALWVPLVFVVFCGAEIGLSVWALVGSTPLPIPPQLNMRSCITNSGPENVNRLWVFWFCPVVTDTFIILLTLLRSYQLHIRAAGAKIPILRILVRDGLIYYVFVLVANLLNTIWFLTKPVTENQALHAPLAMIVTTIAASRLSLSMRDPANNEVSSASVSRFRTTGAGTGNTTAQGTVGSKQSATPTYPLQDLRTMDDSNLGLAKFGDEEKVVERVQTRRSSAEHSSGQGNGLRYFGDSTGEAV